MGLVARGHDVTVLTRYPTDYLPARSSGGQPDLPEEQAMAGVKVVRVRGFGSHKSRLALRCMEELMFSIRLLVRALREPLPDAVFVYSPPLVLAAVAALSCRLRSVPLVLNLHDFYPRTAVQLGYLRNRWLIRWAERTSIALYKAAAAIVVPNSGSRSLLVEEYRVPGRKIAVIHNWVNTKVVDPASRGTQFRARIGAKGRFVVSYAGLMGYAQDLAAVLACVSSMQQEDIVFVLAGDGNLAGKVEAAVAGLPNAVYLPMLDRAEYFALLQASDVCLMPLTATLRSPAVPGKLQSIMAAGRPVIAVVPIDSVAAEMVREIECGMVVAPGDVAALREAVERLCRNRLLAHRYGANGRRAAEALFDIEPTLDKFESVFQGLSGVVGPAGSGSSTEQVA